MIGCHASELFTYENVVFHRTNDVFVHDASWTVTFVHDLKAFQLLIDKINNDLERTDNLLKATIDFYEKGSVPGYAETFKSLHIEVDMLTDVHNSIYGSFAEYQSLASHDHMTKRSLLPVIGELMSSLFGTVSESDLENINRNIKTLATNQKQIIHDVSISLSVLNLTRTQVVENRRSIMDLIIVIQKLDKKIYLLEQTLEHQFVRLEQYVHTYIQLQMILNEIMQTTQNAIAYLENLKSELDTLALQHLSINTISPRSLKELLLDVESKLPSNFELPSNPRHNIWYFYKSLTTITYLRDSEIRIILKIPLLNTREEYEVFRVYNLPLSHIDHPGIMFKYRLETLFLMITKDRLKFSFLSEHNYQLCNSVHRQFCNPNTPIYIASVNKFCVIALFMGKQTDISELCKQMVTFDQAPPYVEYISHGIWVIVTVQSLTFTINCRSNNFTKRINVHPPVGFVKLNNSCGASNQYFHLPEYFSQHSYFERSDPLQNLLKLRNVSSFEIWNVSRMAVEKLKPLRLPKHLLTMKEIPLHNFLQGTGMYQAIDFDEKINKPNWTMITIIIAASLLVLVLASLLISRKFNCVKLRGILGKRKTAYHDSGKVSVDSPSHEEGAEMSVFHRERNVIDESEGREQTFKRTDATLAWTQKPTRETL